MKIDRRSTPIVYQRMPLRERTEIERQRAEQDKILWDVLLLAYAFGFVVFLALVIG